MSFSSAACTMGRGNRPTTYQQKQQQEQEVKRHVVSITRAKSAALAAALIGTNLSSSTNEVGEFSRSHISSSGSCICRHKCSSSSSGKLLGAGEHSRLLSLQAPAEVAPRQGRGCLTSPKHQAMLLTLYVYCIANC